MASDELWNHDTESEKELPAKKAFRGFGRDELPVGRVGRTNGRSYEDPKDLESIRNGEDKLWQILVLRKQGHIRRRMGPRQFWTEHRDQRWNGTINVLFHDGNGHTAEERRHIKDFHMMVLLDKMRHFGRFGWRKATVTREHQRGGWWKLEVAPLRSYCTNRQEGKEEVGVCADGNSKEEGRRREQKNGEGAHQVLQKHAVEQ